MLPFILTCSRYSEPTESETHTTNVTLNKQEPARQSRYVDKTLVVEVDPRADIGATLLRNPLTEERVKDFYVALIGDEEITDIVIRYALEHDIPLDLAISLAWVESRFNPYAVSANYSSIDRGLYQLNSRSFPSLAEHEFFNPEINARLGLNYLNRCIKQGGNVVAGLAMYNAGRGRVEQGGTPRMTLDYISKILEYRKNLNENFEAYIGHSGIDLHYQHKETRVVLNN